MSYRCVDEAFWLDPKVRALSSRDKLLFIYLITNPHANFSGVYYLPIPMAVFELGLSERDVIAGIETLSENGMVQHDEVNSMFWVVNMAKFQTISEKQAAGVRSHFKSLQRSYLLGLFAERYPHIVDPELYPIDTLSIPYRYPIDIVRVKEKEKVKEKDRDRGDSSRTPRAKSTETDDEWLARLRTEYPDLDVDGLHAKMHAWCERKREVPTRRRLECWLKKEKPIAQPAPAKDSIDIMLEELNAANAAKVS